MFGNELRCVGQPHRPWVPEGCPKGAGDVSHQPSAQTRLHRHFKAPKHSQGYLYSLSPHPKSPLAWEEEEGEQGDVAEEDKAGERRICGELIGGELALCPVRFLFRWLCAGFACAPARGGSMSLSIPPCHGWTAQRGAGQAGVRGAQGRERSQSCGCPSMSRPRVPGAQGAEVCSSGVQPWDLWLMAGGKRDKAEENDVTLLLSRW